MQVLSAGDLKEKLEIELKNKPQVFANRPVVIFTQDTVEDDLGFEENITYKRVIDVYFNNKNELVIEVDK